MQIAKRFLIGAPHHSVILTSLLANFPEVLLLLFISPFSKEQFIDTSILNPIYHK